MKNSLYILFIISITNFSNSQEICLKIDSIECYRIPWNLKSNFNIYKDEIILEESFSKWRVKNVITNKQALHFFIEANFMDTSKVLRINKSYSDIDARALLILNYNNGLKDTIIFNGNSSYHYGHIVYLSNVKLLLWLIQYNPLPDPNREFIKPEDVNKLRQEYNFMMK